MSKKIKILILLYGLISLALFFYSFTQVDLSFAHVLQGIHGEIQRKITYFGYFNRPGSTAIFTAIIFSLTLFSSSLFQDSISSLARISSFSDSLSTYMALSYCVIYARIGFSIST